MCKMNKNGEQYKVFKQVINAFYTNDTSKSKEIHPKIDNLSIEPQLIYDTFHKTLKAEFRIGDGQLYKIKSLPEFFEHMLNNEEVKYGAKLNFIHTKDAFKDSDQKLLEFVLKYAEIIKYSNETVGSYGKYMRTMSNEYITISNTGLDELFDVLQNKKVKFKMDSKDSEIVFINENPKVVFSIEQDKSGDYILTPNLDVFSYDMIKGSSYNYMLTSNFLYRCDSHFCETVLKLLNVYRENYTASIRLKREELPTFCSLIYPKLKDKVSLKHLDKSLIDKYIPQELFVKLYLDYEENNYITADIKFVYGDREFNPLDENNLTIARDISKENEYLDIFVNTGFMLDRENKRLILANDDMIYQFLSEEIDEYMQKFEVLVTDNFKNKEIRKPKIGSIGVKIENDLLRIDLSQMDFDVNEIREIMEKYTLKKKFHRLKDGSFLELEENETMNFINSLMENEDVGFDEIQKGEIKLPVSRTMYLDRILETIDTNVVKGENYKKIVNQISKRDIEDNIRLPKGLKSELRNYQVTGFKWLKILDMYKFGGILADDMGLRKNNTATCCFTVLSRRKSYSEAKYCCMSKFAFS